MLLKSKVTSKGQITIPKLVRDSMKLRTGDVVNFSIDASGVARISPSSSDPESRGILRHLVPKRPVSPEDMDVAIRNRARRVMAVDDDSRAT